jgi:inosose dehydratase
MPTRRDFVKSVSILGSTVYFSSKLSAFPNPIEALEVSCQQYPWFTFFRREGRKWSENLEFSMDHFSSVGFQGFEPSFASVEEVAQLHPILKKHGLPTHSLYVNSVLHDPEQTAVSIAQVISIAKAAQVLGVKILVTNPSPINWGGPEDKSDKQLMIQADALNELGKQLKDMGITLAYHNHDAEMRNSAREFHHMMLGTDPENVSLCLDAHWIYRGSGNSQVALYDIVDLYINRIVELHLRQSKDGIWTEEFTEGDIDYTLLVKKL